MAIETEHVFQAADEIADNGITPTIKLVRNKIGAGSYSTISAAMKLWRGAQNKEDEITEVPQRLSVKSKIFTSAMWELALVLAKEKFDDESHESNEQIVNLTAELKDANEIIEDYELRIDDLKKDLEQLKLSESSLQEYKKQKESEVESLLRDKESLVSVLEEKDERLESLKQNFDAMLKDAVYFKDESSKLNETCDKLTEENELLKKEVSELKATVQQMRQTIEIKTADISSAKTQIESLKADYEKKISSFHAEQASKIEDILKSIVSGDLLPKRKARKSTAKKIPENQ